MMFQSIAVFCGSQCGINPLFEQHAVELGKYLGANNITLIYPQFFLHFHIDR